MYFRLLHGDTSGELTYLLADADAREAMLEQRRWYPFFAGLSRDEFLSHRAHCR